MFVLTAYIYYRVSTEAMAYIRTFSNAPLVHQLEYYDVTHCRLVNILECASWGVTPSARVYSTPPMQVHHLHHVIIMKLCLPSRKSNAEDLLRHSLSTIDLQCARHEGSATDS